MEDLPLKSFTCLFVSHFFSPPSSHPQQLFSVLRLSIDCVYCSWCAVSPMFSIHTYAILFIALTNSDINHGAISNRHRPQQGRHKQPSSSSSQTHHYRPRFRRRSRYWSCPWDRSEFYDRLRFDVHQANITKKKWPDLKAERFASQDITDLSNALRTGNVLLEFRILRPFLVAWKDKIKNRDDISPEELTNLAASLCALNSRQLGPVEKQVQIDSTVADNAHKASEVDNGPYVRYFFFRIVVWSFKALTSLLQRLYTGGYYLDHFEQNWPSTLSDVFHYQQGWYLEEIDFEEGPEKCRVRALT